MPEISIIVPVYNVEKYLRRCVDSILAQTFTDFELLLIDDGSSDHSGAICDEYAAKDSCVRVFHKENGGVSSARNLGLDHAQGKYVGFIDSDDSVDSRWCEKLYQKINSLDIDLAVCRICNIYEDGTKKYQDLLPEKWVGEVTKIEFIECTAYNFIMSLVTKIFKSDIIQENKLRFNENLSHAEDVLFVVHYIQHCERKIFLSNDYLYNYYHVNEGSLTNSYVANMWDIQQLLMKETRQVYENCGISPETIGVQYYSNLLVSFSETINSILCDSNKNGFFAKMKQGQQVLSCEEYRKAVNLGEFKEFHPVYKIVLKTRCFFWVWLFHELLRIKHKLFGVKSKRNA